jgi:hypothetical protein
MVYHTKITVIFELKYEMLVIDHQKKNIKQNNFARSLERLISFDEEKIFNKLLTRPDDESSYNDKLVFFEKKIF